MDPDLKSWLKNIKGMGELQVLEDVDWDLEIGCITTLNSRGKSQKALLFDKIKGYPAGYRVLTNSMTTASRYAATMGLPQGLSNRDLVVVLRDKLLEWQEALKKYPPEKVKSGPVLDHVDSDAKVDLFKFPAPRWHDKDGGRFIGTGCCVITRDPDSGRVNLAVYRNQVHDQTTVGIMAGAGRHGRLDWEKYHRRGKSAPIAISLGHHPLMLAAAGSDLIHENLSEYHLAGSVQGYPVKVIEEEITGLPIPAESELVLAGWCPPDKYVTEGPFGEWTGYYAGASRPEPVLEVRRIYYRNNPIILGAPPDRGPSDFNFFHFVQRSANLYNQLLLNGIPGLKGVWMNEVAGQQFIVVSIKQMYEGHSKQVGMLAAQSRIGSNGGRYVVVVDEDVDPADMNQVVWALSTRSDPEKSIEIVKRCRSNPLDPMVRKPTSTYFNSRAIIDACKPLDWIQDFPAEITHSPELESRMRQQWGQLLKF